jgi:hypothetical protein
MKKYPEPETKRGCGMQPAKYRTIGGRLIGVSILMASAQVACAAPPELKTPAPVIYLADNLDEKDKLGWCIDTLGRGWSDRLQAHSCKPYGGDVQFRFDRTSRQLKSVEFNGKCAELVDATSKTVAFGLLDCADGSARQKFDFDGERGRFKPAGQPGLCLAVGAASKSAGPFMSRALILADCEATDARFTTWIVKSN